MTNETNKVLLVEDDQECLDECAETLSNLGYTVCCAVDALTALKLLSDDRDIGIVITDIQMPGMDGLTFLEELSQRFMRKRPMVALVITAAPSLEAATQAMRAHAADFLPKPVSVDILAAAMRRASAELASLSDKFQLAKALDNYVQEQDDSVSAEVPSPSLKELQAFVQSLLKHQQNRARFFDPELYSGPSWDILLDLAEAHFRGAPVAVSSVCASTQVPLSTALRHVNNLVQAGLVRRWTDSNDKRRKMLELHPETSEQMRKYLESGWKIHSRRQ